MIALVLALLLPTASAAEMEKIGDPAFDRIFNEVSSLDGVLDAAEGRLGRLQREVARAAGLSPNTPIDRSVYAIKESAGGDVRLMNVGGRPILALGMKAPSQAKAAAGVLNEGTQEVAVMATDLSRLPGHLEKLADKVEGLDGAAAPPVERNLAVTVDVRRRASEVAERARQLLDDVRAGVQATEAPAEPEPAVVAAKPEAPRPVQSLPDLLSKVWIAVKQEDLEEARSLLGRADQLLPRQTVPVSRGDLVELFELRGHVSLLSGDATAAAWAAAQALTVHPDSEPLSRFGGDYARLHRALAKADIVRKVDVLVSGDGRAYLSGYELGRNSQIQLGQGQHLLQVERGDHWESSVVYVRDGFVVELD